MGKVMVAPNGARIIASIDLIQADALLNGATRLPDGSLDLEYYGESEIDWDSQTTTKTPKGERLFRCDRGYEWPESQLRLMDEDDYEAWAAALEEDEHAPMIPAIYSPRWANAYDENGRPFADQSVGYLYSSRDMAAEFAGSVWPPVCRLRITPKPGWMWDEAGEKLIRDD